MPPRLPINTSISIFSFTRDSLNKLRSFDSQQRQKSNVRLPDVIPSGGPRIRKHENLSIRKRLSYGPRIVKHFANELKDPFVRILQSSPAMSNTSIPGNTSPSSGSLPATSNTSVLGNLSPSLRPLWNTSPRDTSVPRSQSPALESVSAISNTSEPRKPVFALLQDELDEELQKALDVLWIDRQGGGKWELSSSGKGLERTVRFKTFKTTWVFMNQIAEECSRKEIRHHPEWSNVYNTTFIRWTTHSPSGLTSKDILMAQFTDATALALGELMPTPDSSSTQENAGVRDLAGVVAAEAGSCCVPKKVAMIEGKDE